MDYEEEVEDEREEEEVDIIGEYEGQRNEKCQRHGIGRALLPNKDYYEGRYYQGLRNGLGLYIFKNGSRYNGHYLKGKKEGIGIFIYPDGSKYEGEWKDDERHGYGIYYYPNGDFYEGQWRKGIKEGLGCYCFKESGAKYLGLWKFGRMNGPGQQVTPTYRYHGNWIDNLPYGKGLFAFPETKVMQLGFYLNMLQPLTAGVDVQDEEEQSEVLPVWRPREVIAYSVTHLPPEPKPLEYPSDVSSAHSSTPTPPPSTDVYQKDFFKELAEYDKYYMDDKLLWQTDKWDSEVLQELKDKTMELARGIPDEGSEHEEELLNQEEIGDTPSDVPSSEAE